LFLICFIPLISVAEADTTNFKKLNGKIEFQPNFLFQNMSLTIKGAKTIVTYEPGKSGAIGLTVSYKGIDLGLNYSVVSEGVGSLNEKTQYYDIRLNGYSRRFGLDANFQWYSGFSIAELPESVPDSLTGIIQPNLGLVNYGFNLFYSFNKKMSLKSIFKYRERQLKSSGAFIVGLSQNYTRLSFTNTIFPDNISADWNIETSENKGLFYALIPTIGYQYNFVNKNFHISPSISYGIGVQYQNYSSNNKNNFKGYKKGNMLSANLPIGYNGDNVYYGVIGRYNQSVFKLEKNAKMDYSLLSLKIFVGIRFK
jgi:hypothetical protein